MVPWKLLRTVGLRGGVGSYLHLPLFFTVYLQLPAFTSAWYAIFFLRLPSFTYICLHLCYIYLHLPMFTYIFTL